MYSRHMCGSRRCPNNGMAHLEACGQALEVLVVVCRGAALELEDVHRAKVHRLRCPPPPPPAPVGGKSTRAQPSGMCRLSVLLKPTCRPSPSGLHKATSAVHNAHML